MALNDLDRSALALALSAAQLGLYSTSPNPRVGAVIVRNQEIIAIGAHFRAGQPHAEINAIAQARAQGHSLQGATLYVTLTPCNHWGRTPPCAQALIDEGFAQVVIASADPHPLAQGGAERLRQAGVRVIDAETIRQEAPELYDLAYELNRGFFSRLVRQKPYVTLKMAMSLDGRIATTEGKSQWLSGEPSRHDGQYWRARSCAILTGIGTVSADRPRLSVRNPPPLIPRLDHPLMPKIPDLPLRQPRKIVLDSLGVMDPTTPLLQSGQTLCVGLEPTPSFVPNAHRKYWQAPERQGRIDLSALLSHLAQQEINELFIECGARLFGSFLQEEGLDQLIFYIAPKFLGSTAQALAQFSQTIDLNHPWDWQLIDSTRFDQDIRLTYRKKNGF